jgi:pimeloyl-ACP methyl ester carboxylesterase
LKLAFDSEGDGPLVVLLHGFPESRITWRRVMPVLAAAGFRVVAPDLRGYGDSPAPRGADAYRLPLLVDDVAELITEPCVVVGHDWGALVAWFLAMTKPELVRRLVIANVPHPALFVREVRRNRKQMLLASYQVFFQLPVLPELFMRLFGRRLMKKAGRFPPELIDAYAAQWKRNLTPMLNYYRAMRKTRGALRPMMRRIDVPTLIIWGEREPVMLPSTLEGTEEWVPDVRIEKIARAGHFVQHDATEKVNGLLLDFLGSSRDLSSRA